MSALSENGDDENWEYNAIERSEAEKHALYEVDLQDPRVALSSFIPLIEFEDGSLRITKRLR